MGRNPGELPRTAEFRARLEVRRSSLEKELSSVVPARSHITLEVGCGHGHFLTAFALAHPQALCLGVDLAADRITRARRKRDRARLERLHFLQADANMVLETLPREVHLERIFILFPDPWPKSRHHKHRVVQAEFLQRAAARATPDCQLFFRTDYQPYFAAVQRELTSNPHWTIVDAAWPFEHETVFQSRAPSFHSLVATPRASVAEP